MESTKTRVTFRIDPVLASALRQVSNQTLFVETALLAALGETCPMCEGRGKVPAVRLVISDFKAHKLPRIGREEALRLRDVVKLGHQLMATQLELTSPKKAKSPLRFSLTRHATPLLSGQISEGTTSKITLH